MSEYLIETYTWKAKEVANYGSNRPSPEANDSRIALASELSNGPVKLRVHTRRRSTAHANSRHRPHCTPPHMQTCTRAVAGIGFHSRERNILPPCPRSGSAGTEPGSTVATCRLEGAKTSCWIFHEQQETERKTKRG